MCSLLEENIKPQYRYNYFNTVTGGDSSRHFGQRLLPSLAIQTGGSGRLTVLRGSPISPADPNECERPNLLSEGAGLQSGVSCPVRRLLFMEI